MNQRSAARFAVALPVTIGKEVTNTRDISATGVYFETNRKYKAGSEVKFSVDLQYVRADGPLRLVCRGHIVRVEHHGERVGIAVAVDVHRFEMVERKASKRGA